MKYLFPEGMPAKEDIKYLIFLAFIIFISIFI